MNKRTVKKKVKERYNYGIEFLYKYCELPKETVIKEVGSELMVVANDLNEINHHLIPYLDSISIELMWKFGTGWTGKEKDLIGNKYTLEELVSKITSDKSHEEIYFGIKGNKIL